MKLSQKLVGPLTEAEVTTLEELGRHHRFADIRFRARGVISLHAGCKPRTIAQVLGVSEQSVYNWAKWWELAGLVGLLGGHQGGRPAKLTAALVDSAMAIAAAEALTLGEIKQRVRERHPQAADFSKDRLAARLKARGFSFNRCRLSLKKNAPMRNSPRRKPPSNN
jgi:transposase